MATMKAAVLAWFCASTLAAPQSWQGKTRDLGNELPAAVLEERLLAPVVTGAAPAATYTGSALGLVESFRGIPFAQQPVGTNRLKPPAPLTKPLGSVSATAPAKSCMQMPPRMPQPGTLPTETLELLQRLPLFKSLSNSGEDCLTVNIQRPAGTKANAKLPVLFYIFGGGFELGSSSMYDGTFWIQDSILSGHPIVYVAVNYRVGGWGWLAGKEIKEAGASNLGLLDQRLALQWVADNIAQFGGDPDKVTIWGESAGAISVWDQMALYNGNHTYKGKPLFRGAMMNSGSIVPANPVDSPKAQAVYDHVTQTVGCNTAADSLQCLRELSGDDFRVAVNSVPGILDYQSLALSYLPRPDGKVLTDAPDALLRAGKYANVPFIVGDQEDEGTLFSLVTFNVTDSEKLVNYLATYYFPDAPRSVLQGLVATYPTDPSAGSPFRTGPLNELYPGFKRIAALLGDITFNLTRRIFLFYNLQLRPASKCWSYSASFFYGVPVVGTTHGTDLLPDFSPLPPFPASTIRSYYLSFVNSLDPNTYKLATLPTWPQYDRQTVPLIDIQALRVGSLSDTYRNATFDFLLQPENLLRI